MGETSKIQWTDATWNIGIGCSKVDEDCKYCYMYRGSWNGTRYDPKQVMKTKKVFNLPLRLKEPHRIFTSSLTDVFHPDCDPFRDEMWEIIRKCPQHIFQILTKRPERILENLPADWGQDGYQNVWLGTSVGSMASIGRIADLVTPIRKGNFFLSLEPLHSSIYLDLDTRIDSGHGLHDLIDWVIIGGESGNETGKYRYRKCEISWIIDLINQCQFYDIPVFVKQLGTHLAKELKLKDRHGGDISEWPTYLQVREFPKVMKISL